MSEVLRGFVSGVIGAAGTSVLVQVLWKPGRVRRAEAEREIWHGRTLHLQRVVTALLRGDRAEALRLVEETRDQELMRSVATTSEKS